MTHLNISHGLERRKHEHKAEAQDQNVDKFHIHFAASSLSQWQVQKIIGHVFTDSITGQFRGSFHAISLRNVRFTQHTKTEATVAKWGKFFRLRRPVRPPASTALRRIVY